MRKMGSELLGLKGLDDMSIAQMGNWEAELQAFNEAYKSLLDWKSVAMKLSAQCKATVTCWPIHLSYPTDFSTPPFAGVEEGTALGVRDERTLEFELTLAPGMMRVGALAYTKYPNAAIWLKLAMFSAPGWPKHAQEVTDWVKKVENDAAGKSEQAIAVHHGVLNGGLVAKMVGIEGKLDRTLDVVAALLSTSGTADDHRLACSQQTTFESQQQTINGLEEANRAHLAITMRKDEEIAMLRAQLAQLASNVGSSASSTLLASSTLPTVPATLTLTPVASSPASLAEGLQYQPGDDKQLSLDISVQSSGQGMFAMFGERLHIRPAAGDHRHGKSYGEIIAKHPRLTDFFGDGATNSTVAHTACSKKSRSSMRTCSRTFLRLPTKIQTARAAVSWPQIATSARTPRTKLPTPPSTRGI